MIALILLPLFWLSILAITDAIKPAYKLDGQYCDWRMSDGAVDDCMRAELIRAWDKGLTKIQRACLESGTSKPLGAVGLSAILLSRFEFLFGCHYDTHV